MSKFEDQQRESVRSRYDTYMTEAIGYLGDCIHVFTEIPSDPYGVE